MFKSLIKAIHRTCFTRAKPLAQVDWHKNKHNRFKPEFFDPMLEEQVDVTEKFMRLEVDNDKGELMERIVGICPYYLFTRNPYVPGEVLGHYAANDKFDLGIMKTKNSRFRQETNYAKFTA